MTDDKIPCNWSPTHSTTAEQNVEPKLFSLSDSSSSKFLASRKKRVFCAEFEIWDAFGCVVWLVTTIKLSQLGCTNCKVFQMRCSELNRVQHTISSRLQHLCRFVEIRYVSHHHESVELINYYWLRTIKWIRHSEKNLRDLLRTMLIERATNVSYD